MHRQAFLTALLFCLAAMGLGLVTNAFRTQPLPVLQALPSLMEGDISVEGALALHSEGEALFLDARSPRAYRRAHIPGAVLFTEQSIPQGSKVVTYCSGRLCPKAQDLAQELRVKGYEVFVLHAGIQEWADRGYPLKGGDEP